MIIYDLYLKYFNPIKYARKKGVKIGEKCRIVESPKWGSEPWLIEIGNHVEISFQCAFITHDGATWTFRDKDRYKNVIRFSRIRIGDNSSIGARTIIMPGVTIGNDVIVGAGSLVTKSIPSGEIWGGVPAKYITSVMEYAEKCLRETPNYDIKKYKDNFREEVLRICDMNEEE